MPGLRDAITKTLLRLSEGVEARPRSRARNNSKLLSAADSALQTGRNLGPYRIVKHLGAGGMGHVYLALHTRLGRHVALKFLPPDLTADEEMLRRLEGEAQTASRLNHPNILTIYDIGQLEGEHYIASEYVDGATLRNALERHAVDPAMAIDIVSQVLSALVDAHAAGVIHRDLKPGNIMIRRDGYVKVIDFGLAKQTRRSSSSGSTWTDDITHLGAIIGTVDYMSPEQARGDAVDQRTDLWSLGVILYEAITHRRPFEGDTENHVIVNILDKPASPITEISDLPASLSDVIQRALAKDPSKRYQSAREMLADLQAIRRSSHIESSVYRLAVPPSHRSRKPLVWAAIAFAALISLGSAWWLVDGRDRFFPEWTQLELVRQLTFNGRTQIAALSPDGQYLAFVVGESDSPQTLFLKQVNTPSEEVKIPARKVNYQGITFSRNSQSIFEVEKDETKTGKLFVVPVIGSAPNRPLIEDIDGPVSFSPDGLRFAFIRHSPRKLLGSDQTESSLYIGSLDGLAPKPLFSSTEYLALMRVAWSPMNDRIVMFLTRDPRDQRRETILDIVDLARHEQRRALPEWRLIGQPCWTEHARTIIATVVYQNESDYAGQLREVNVHSGQIRQITKDVTGYKSVSLAQDGKLLSAIRTEAKTRLWISDSRDFTHGQSFAAESDQRPSLAWLNKENLVINSLRGGFPNLWLFNPIAQSRTSLTDQPFVDQAAVVVPNSPLIVFNSNRDGRMHLWQLNSKTNQLKQLTFGPTYDEAPSVSSDGKWIVYTAWNLNNPHLRGIATNGGESWAIRDYAAQDPQLSPDGKWIACLLQDPKTLKWLTVIVPSDGSGEPRKIDEAQSLVRWVPHTNTLSAVVTDSKGVSNVWQLPINGSSPRQLTHFDDEKILNFAWSPEGDKIACMRASLGSDVVLFRRHTAR
jgi:serine/threonine protein kinase